jgi:nicastrin
VKFASIESANDAKHTGINLGIGQPLGKPPNYYVSVYNHENGQAFVSASGFKYGAMDYSAEDKDAEVKDYGATESDTFLLRPTLLEMSLNGLLNNFLGRGSFAASSSGETVPELVDCASSNDCSPVSYCSSSNELAATPTCAGGKCVCGFRSHYHPAVDEAISPATNRAPGWFKVDENDEGVSAMFAEPFWSSYVGVRAFNDAGKGPGMYASITGALFTLICVVIVYRLKKLLVKEKVY